MAQIAELLPAVVLVTSVRALICRRAKITRAYNSVYVIDHDGSVLSVYDSCICAFGEYLPFQN